MPSLPPGVLCIGAGMAVALLFCTIHRAIRNRLRPFPDFDAMRKRYDRIATKYTRSDDAQ